MQFDSEEKLPKVTIVTVAFNLLQAGREEWFRQCLESVTNQTYPNIEHIVMDGASTDGTIELLEEYRLQNQIVYYSEPDEGLYDAMNKGIQKATGKYVAFLNSDDFFHNSSAVALSVNALEQEQSDFSCAASRYLNGDKIIATVSPARGIGVFFLEMPFSHQTMFTKREILLKEGGFDNKNYLSVADYDLVVRLIMKGYKVSIVNENIVSNRHGGISSNQNLVMKELDKMRQKYFSKILKEFHGWWYKLIIPNEMLEQIKSSVCEIVRDHIKKSKISKTLESGVIFRASPYLPYKKQISFLSIPLISTEYLNFPLDVINFAIRMWSIKLFEMKKTQFKTKYKVLYIPIVTFDYNP